MPKNITKYVIIIAMTGHQLREARKAKGWTQQRAAARLRVSQGYLSMWERSRRPVPAKRLRRLLQVYDLPPLALPLRGANAWQVHADELAAELGGLGYPGFAYMKHQPTWNPAELLVAALTQNNLEARLVEGLPWLVLAFWNMDWSWTVREAKVHDVQNRLGFVVTLARELAEMKRDNSAAARLREVESQLHRSVLAGEQTLCNEAMTLAERRWLRERGSRAARQWNLLSDLTTANLSHA